MKIPAVPLSALTAPKHWTAIDFVSDLHLQASEGATFDAWQRYLAGTQADAIFILGDLFEVWVGDDVLPSPLNPEAGLPLFEAQCAQVLRHASRQHSLYFMPGNRDFLFLDSAASACGVTRLADPCCLTFAGQNFLLSHGDALCLDDTEYMAFRAQVRSPAWQTAFLAKPLSERKQLARTMREQSESRKRREPSVSYADADPLEATKWLDAASAQHLIHGHTHKPADHALGQGRLRQVLSDWDANATPVRAEVLRLHRDAASGTPKTLRIRLADLV